MLTEQAMCLLVWSMITPAIALLAYEVFDVDTVEAHAIMTLIVMIISGIAGFGLAMWKAY